MLWETVVPRDTTQFEASLERLIRSSAVEDDQLVDYNLQQAFRSLCYVAVNTKAQYDLQTHIPSELAGETGSETSTCYRVKGREALWYLMCSRAVKSVSAFRTLTFLSTKLLCSESTDLGEGNERPYAGDSWRISLLSLGLTSRNPDVKSAVFHRVEGVDRRYILGHLFLSLGTLRCLTCAEAPKPLYLYFTKLAESWCDLLLPKVCLLADEPSTVGPQNRPSVLTVESNNFIIHSFLSLSRGTLLVHRQSNPDQAGEHPVLDRDAPQHMWGVLDALPRALVRSSIWMECELQSWQGVLQDELAQAADAGKSQKWRSEGSAVKADAKLFAHFRTQLQEVFSRMVRKQEEYDVTRRRIAELYGENAKDYHQVSELMWMNTLRLCVAVRAVTEAYAQAVGGVALFHAALKGYGPPSSRSLLRYIGGCIAEIPQLNADSAADSLEEEQSHLALLAALTVITFAAPCRVMQRNLWASDMELTAQIQLVLSEKGLRLRNSHSVQLASVLLSSIWSVATDSPAASGLISSTSEQLLDMLSQSRDGASHCVVELVSQAAVDRPHIIVPSLFRLLTQGTKAARQNAMDVLAALPRLGDNTEDDEEADREMDAKDRSHADKMAVLLRTLANHLLLHLHDEELQVRMQAADLFSRVNPEDVMGPLVGICIQADPTGRRYASATGALLSVVASHRESADVLLLMMRECFAVVPELGGEDEAANGSAARRKVPQHPGDVLTYALLNSSEMPSEGNSVSTPDGTSSAATTIGAKKERLEKLVCSAAAHWQAAVEVWQPSLIDPLLLFALNTTDNLQRQQWVAKVILHTLFDISKRQPEAVSRSVSSLFADVDQWQARWKELGSFAAEALPLKVFRASFPLLCVRKCASLWGLQRVDLDREQHRHLRGIWHSVWLALTDPELRVGNARVPEFTAVELDILSLFPSNYFFSRFEEAFGEEEGLLQPDAALLPSILYVSYLTRVVVRSTDRSDSSREQLVREKIQFPLKIISARVLPWLHEDEEEGGLTAKPSPIPRKEMSVLCTATCELLAALMMVGIVTGPTAVCWWREVYNIVFLPLRTYAEGIRAEMQPIGDQPAAARPDAVGEESLPAFMLAISIHEGFVKHYQMHGRSIEFFVKYLHLMTPLLIEAANASAVSFLKRATEWSLWNAVQCGNLLFQIIMLTSRVPESLFHSRGPAAAPESAPSAGTADEEDSGITVLSAPQAVPAVRVPKTVLEVAGAALTRTLITFALGCLRFTKSVQIQDVGVKLFSALVGISSDLVAECDEEAFASAAAALVPIARLHPTPATRQVAERLVQLMTPSED